MGEPINEIRRRLNIIESYSKNYKESLDKKEYGKASEMLWGIINNLASILSILNGGKPISKHSELREFINSLAYVLKDEEIIDLFRSCEILHANYFHNFLDEILFESYRKDAEKLINKLQELTIRELQAKGIKI